MKNMYCWRCKIIVPMLDEDEYTLISQLYSEAMRANKEYRQKYGLNRENLSMEDRFRPVCHEYNRLTGFEEDNENAIMHHRISLYGVDCHNCKKTLRTPKASFCAACGMTKQQ